MRLTRPPYWVLGVLVALLGLLLLFAAPGCALATIRPRPAPLPVPPVSTVLTHDDLGDVCVLGGKTR